MRHMSASKRAKQSSESLPMKQENLRPHRGRRDPLGDLFLDVQRTGDRLMQGLEEALRPTKITPVQYLVLRSLRRAGIAGMPSNQIVREMTTHDPDMTRLLDKLEKRGIIVRRRDADDRRIYRVSMTRQGARVLKNLTKITRDLHRKQFTTLTRKQIASVSRLLETMNQAPIPDLDDDR